MNTGVEPKMGKESLPTERRAAAYLFKLLGQPEEHVTNADEWEVTMREAVGHMEMEYEDFKKFLYWVMEENAMSAEYMRKANNPPATLVKNIKVLKKLYTAWAKAQSIIEKKKQAKPKGDNLPAYRQESGKREILKGDV
jgi:hypothetical protein